LIDSAGVPHLLDFGIAKLLDDNATQTSSRFVPFTPGYASPEQVAGRPVSISSDIYSAGLLLFELLTDQLPSRIESLSEPRDPPLPSTVISEESVEVARDRRTTVGRLRQRLRGDLDEILAKALRWQPEERYGSARELAEDIERHLRSLPILARKGSRQYRIRRFVRRHRLGLLALVSGLAILGFATAAGVQSWRLARQGEETVAMIRELAGPDSSHLMDTGSLDRAVEQILSLDSSQESKSLLLALLNRVNIPEEQLLLQSNRFFAERAASGTGDPRTAELGLLLGEMLFHGGYFEAAEGILADSVEIARQAFGARSAALPEYLEMHARVLAELERYEEGIEALNLSIRLRGESAAEAIRQAEPQYQLSCLHYLRGSFIEAAESGRRALEILDRNGGGESGFRSQVLKALAVAWIEVEPRDGAAIEMAREAVEIDLDRHGPHHMETIQARHNLAMVLARGGRIEEALGVAEENLRLAEIGQGADHPRLGYILSGMAQGYQAVGRPENCVEVARRAVEIRSGGLPPGSFLTAASQMRLASCLVDLGQFDEAEELLQTSIQTFEQSRVQNGARLAEARAVLAKLKESKVNAERYPAP
jgi:serine/threonine-protein kinase